MSSQNENLQNAIRALADETRGAHASDRVRDALRVELRNRTRRRRYAAWWPAAAAAALLIGIWLGIPRKSDLPQVPNVAVAQPSLTQAPQLPQPAEVGTDREISQPQPLPTVTRSATPRVQPAAVTPQSAATESGIQAITPWYFYTGLPVSTRGQVVRIRVSNQTAAQFGILAASDAVPAQVFIGDDGVARAIRFIH